MSLWADLDNISEYQSELDAIASRPARKLVQRVGPVLTLKHSAYSEPDVDDDDDAPDEDDFGQEIEDLPFDDWDEDDEQ